MNPAAFSDPQVIPQLVPPRGRDRPTLYSPELIEEFCGRDLIVMASHGRSGIAALVLGSTHTTIPVLVYR